MRNENALRLFRLLWKRGRSVEELMEKTGLSHVTIRKICNLLCSKKYLQSYTEISNQVGKRPEHFIVSRKCYSVYMHEDKYRYMIVAVNPYYDILFRHDYIKKKRYSYKEDLLEAVKTVTTRADYIYCINFYANGSDECMECLPDNVKGVRLKTFISENVPPKNESVIIEFSNECYLSIHGKIYKNITSKDDIKKVIPDAKVMSYKENILFGMFNALRLSTVNTIEKRIMEM